MSNIKFKIDISLVCHIEEEHILGVIENRVLSKLFGRRRGTGTGY